MSNRVLTVVPPAREGNGAQVTKGTKIYDEHGNAVPGVTKIELVGGLNDVWQGVIHTHSVLLPPEGITANFTEIRKQNCELILHKIGELIQSIIDQTDKKPSTLRVHYDETMGLVDRVELVDSEEK